MDEYAEQKRTENNLIVRSGISEAETTNNKRLRSMFCIEANKLYRHEASRGLFATAELLVVAAISQSRRRFSACVRAHGGHFEHIL